MAKKLFGTPSSERREAYCITPSAALLGRSSEPKGRIRTQVDQKHNSRREERSLPENRGKVSKEAERSSSVFQDLGEDRTSSRLSARQMQTALVLALTGSAQLQCTMRKHTPDAHHPSSDFRSSLTDAPPFWQEDSF